MIRKELFLSFNSVFHGKVPRASGNVVLDSGNMALRDANNILDQIHELQKCLDFSYKDFKKNILMKTCIRIKISTLKR